MMNFLFGKIFSKELLVKSAEALGVKNQKNPSGGAVLYVLMDTSTSMKGQNISEAKRGAKNFAQSAIRKGYCVGVIAFEEHAHYIADPTNDEETVKTAIDSLVLGSMTNMADALHMVKKCFNSIHPDFATVMVITDGVPDSVSAALSAARRLKKDGVVIMTIGTEDADLDFLKKLASSAHLAQVVNASNLGYALSNASRDLLSLP